MNNKPLKSNSLEIPYIGWEVMAECNMECQFCYSSSWGQWQRRGGGYQKRTKISILPKENIIQGLELFKSLNIGVKYINFSGGELLLRQYKTSNTDKNGKINILTGDIPEILKKASELGYKNIISTNCMFTSLFGNEYGKGTYEDIAKNNFRAFLNSINDYIDFMSIAWDSADKDINNNVMRLKGQKAYNKYKDNHFADIQKFLEMYKEEKYSFHLKVNTLVTEKNDSTIYNMLDKLKDVPCIWHLIQFNPRECPHEFREEYKLDDEKFYKLTHQLIQDNALMSKPSKCFITTRMYDGDEVPYCLLVLNTAGDVLLPKGEKHVVLLNIFSKTWDAESFKSKLEKRIAEEINDVDKKHPLQFFSEHNKQILYRYLHPAFRQQEAVRKLNKVSSVIRGLFASVSSWHSAELCDSINKDKKDKEEASFNASIWLDEKIPEYEQIPNFNRVKFFLEQSKLSSFLRGKWGLVGGTMVVLNPNKSSNFRVIPCIDRPPFGIHFPWLCNTLEEKRDFFKSFFSSSFRNKNEIDTITDEKLETKKDIFYILLVCRKLPKDILNSVLEKTFKEPERSKWYDIVKQYLSEQEIIDDEYKNTKLRVSSLILSNCIEEISGKLARLFTKNSKDMYGEPNIKNDPLYQIFYDQNIRKECLSKLENKLNILFVSSEEAIYTVTECLENQEWLKQISIDKDEKEIQAWLKPTQKQWKQLSDNNNVEHWKEYQKTKDKKLQSDVLSKMLEGTKLDLNKRILPIFWLYYFTPFLDKNEDIPNVIYFPIAGPQAHVQTDLIVSFIDLHCNDTILNKLWLNNKWDTNDIDEGDFKKYIHNIANVFSPIAYYNANLELQREISEAILKHGTKAATVAIMSRNISHNVGSHILSYWGTELKNILDSDENQCSLNQNFVQKLKKSIKDEIKELNVLLELNKEQHNLNQSTIKSSKDLFQYIQHRMDFIADLSTSIPCSEMALDFKKDIIDPFIQPQENNCSVLLKYIARSETIDFHKNIELKINPTLINQSVSIPNGIIGIHAIYSIIENFIRNAAKHYSEEDNRFSLCNADLSNYTTILAKLKTSTENIHTIYPFSERKQEIDSLNDKNGLRMFLNEAIVSGKCISFDNRDYENFEQLTTIEKKLFNYKKIIEILSIHPKIIEICLDEPEEWSNDYYVVRIWDLRPNSCNSKILNDCRSYLPGNKNCQFSKQDGELKPGGWGIKEMIVSANFLRKNTSEELYSIVSMSNGEKYGKEIPPLLEINCPEGYKNKKRQEDYKGKLGIEFYLRKPKDLIIDDQMVVINKGLFGIDHLKESMEIPHRILLVKQGDKGFYEKNPKSPCRIIPYSSEELPKSIDDKCYLDYYEYFIKDKLWNGREIEDFPPKIVMRKGARFQDDIYVLKNSLDHKKEITFVNHLSEQTTAAENFIDHNGNPTELFKECFYLQPVSGGYTTKAKLLHQFPTDSLLKRLFCLELIEAALTKVIIVDERINDWAKQAYLGNTNIDTVLQKMGIFTVDFDLNNICLEEIQNKILTIYKEYINNKSCFFVIHQGVLDKLKNKSDQDDDRKLLDVIDDKCNWKVIDSGRGVPEKLEKYKEFNVRFVEISALQKLLQNFDKHGLIQMLYSTRYPLQWEDK